MTHAHLPPAENFAAAFQACQRRIMACHELKERLLHTSRSIDALTGPANPDASQYSYTEEGGELSALYSRIRLNCSEVDSFIRVLTEELETIEALKNKAEAHHQQQAHHEPHHEPHHQEHETQDVEKLYSVKHNDGRNLGDFRATSPIGALDKLVQEGGAPSFAEWCTETGTAADDWTTDPQYFADAAKLFLVTEVQ